MGKRKITSRWSSSDCLVRYPPTLMKANGENAELIDRIQRTRLAPAWRNGARVSVHQFVPSDRFAERLHSIRRGISRFA